MKVTSVELHPDRSSEVCVLSYRDPSRLNRFNVKAMGGLDADDLVSRYYGNQTTGKFYSLMLEKREIPIRIGLNPRFNEGESYSDLRDTLAKMISSSRTGSIQVQFKEDATVKAVVSGRVMKFETSLFTNDPEVIITLKCDDPMLKAPNEVEIDVDGLDPDLTVISDPISTAPHGFKFKIRVIASMNPLFAITLSDPTADLEHRWTFQAYMFGGWDAGDIISFSSEHNNKYLILRRSGVDIHVADQIHYNSVWPILFPGDNTLTINAPIHGGATNVEWVEIFHTPTYWGV